MGFISPVFFVFLFFVVSINYMLPQRFRHLFLIAASCVFIGLYNVESLITLLIFSLFNFYVAKIIIGNRSLYIVSIGVNAMAIILFNYFSFTSVGLIFSFSTITFHIDEFIIALGLSYYSLQNIAYITEVYFKRLAVEKELSRFVLYSSFFPKIISGPILLPNEFLPQINKNTITQEHLISGFQRILLGIFKKMVIADRLAAGVGSVFDYGGNYSGLTVLAASYMFTIQVYFDFSGYTDMALGIAKMLGYDLKENFNMPFRSKSVSEFWRRWHISLISWFTNYIYYPVVYRLRTYKKAAALTGITVTFLISGIWHGIGFTFLAWSICHILYLSFEALTKHPRFNISEKLNSAIFNLFSIFIVFNAICLGNIFFRAESIEAAFQLVKNLLLFSNFIPKDILKDLIAPIAMGGHQIEIFNLTISLLIPLVVLLFERKINLFGTSKKFNIFFVSASVILIMMLGIFNNGARFIYMQF